MELLHHELPSSTLLVISRRARQNHFFDRRLMLQRAHLPATHETQPAAAASPEA